MWDWTTDRCEDENIPDIAARAFRDASGTTHLTIGHYVTYRMSGPSLEELTTDCSAPILDSDYDPDPSRFNDSEWIGSPYTLDGETVYSIVHNEYRGDTHGASRPGQCPSGERLTCLDTSLTMVISTDGGTTFDDITEPPGHMIATLPYVFDDEGVPSGLRQPSNIIRGPGDYFYSFSNISDYPSEDHWVCVMRTDDLADPGSWRFWTGAAFDGVFVDPYREPVDAGTKKCAPLAPRQLSGTVNETVVFDESIGRFVMVGIAGHPMGPEPQWGVYYSMSENLVDWSLRELLIELPVNASVADNVTDLFYAYPSIIDPDSDSFSFETSDGSAYLYISRFNAGGGSLDRDLVRWPIALDVVEVSPPDWTFDVDGDTEGWGAQHAVEPLEAVGGVLVTTSTGDDPYFGVASEPIPAAFDRAVVRMSVSGGGVFEGQLFFATSELPDFTEANSILFPVVADGTMRDYELDLSSIAGWQGLVVAIRLDPAPDSGRRIEIDRIWFPPP